MPRITRIYTDCGTEEGLNFKHLGEIKNGIEENKDWAGALESYYLREENGVTVLTAALDSIPEFLDYFKATFPKPLDIVKKISEEK